MSELKQHVEEHCLYPAKGGAENSNGKTNILLQTYISKGYVECFSLASDFSYVAQVTSCVLRCVALRCVALRCVVLCCVALRFVVLRCVVLYCGVVWYVVVWCGVVWCVVVWCVVVWCVVVCFGMIWCVVVWCDDITKTEMLLF